MTNPFSQSRNELLKEIERLNSEVERLQKYETGYKILKKKNKWLKSRLFELNELLSKILRNV